MDFHPIQFSKGGDWLIGAGLIQLEAPTDGASGDDVVATSTSVSNRAQPEQTP